MERKISCDQAKQIDMVDYLASLGHYPQKIRNADYWYLSPLRDEKTASFKVNRHLNVWYDHALGKGGDLIAFGTRFFNCTVSQFLQSLTSKVNTQNLSFHQPSTGHLTDRRQVENWMSFAGEKKAADQSKIIILDERDLVAKPLVNYLEKRQIPLNIAEQFCREIDFLLYGKKLTAIGFKNGAGGYELRSENFKGSSSPKDIKYIDNGKDQVAVFEGFFSFLSLQTINQKQAHPLTNFLVLNSLSFFQKARETMESHRYVHLFLDRDNAGKRCAEQALQWDKGKYIDRSQFYENRKDLNEWLMHHRYSQKQSLNQGREL